MQIALTAKRERMAVPAGSGSKHPGESRTEILNLLTYFASQTMGIS